jgi:membrane protein insertase Oxa1/YidC/SpoIIIJ
MLKAKDEEIEMKGKEQEKMKTELKKLQKLKEFKPIMVSFLDFVDFFLFLVLKVG